MGVCVFPGAKQIIMPGCRCGAQGRQWIPTWNQPMEPGCR